MQSVGYILLLLASFWERKDTLAPVIFLDERSPPSPFPEINAPDSYYSLPLTKLNTGLLRVQDEPKTKHTPKFNLLDLGN